ncbi:MAG: hypothetical protein GTO22_01525, partial [Gemmatimonadales bacterium]|nr:hypothetical protein [Gemmatimonadales bacterium]
MHRLKSIIPRPALIFLIAALVMSALVIIGRDSFAVLSEIADSNFEIDGDTEVGTDPTGAGDDWENVILDGAYWDTGPGILIRDPHSKATTDPNWFAKGGKFGDPTTWTIEAATGPAQNELTNVGIYPLLPGDIGNTDSWMIMMMERTKEEGTFDLDFEFNQVGFGIRTPGDVVAAFELKGNPEDPDADLEVIILVYDPDRTLDLVPPAGPDSEVSCDTTYGPGGKVEAVGEGTGPCPDYPPGKPTGFVYRFRGPAEALGTFGAATMNGSVAEAALNLTELGIQPGCPGLGTAHAKSRSSIESTADLKDLAGPVSLEVDCAIRGQKRLDTDGDGDFNDADAGIPDWPITLTG